MTPTPPAAATAGDTAAAAATRTAPGTPRAPRIGVTTYTEDASWRGWHRRACLVPQDFLHPLERAGALPVLLPGGGRAEAVDLAGWLDGLLLVGGPDIDPARYGMPRHAVTTGVEPARDGWELALLGAALDADLPVLGVCRGMQLLNVVRGGTLRQHITLPAGTPVHRPDGSSFGRVEVGMRRDRLPGAVLGPSLAVACHHHQAVDTLGAGLVATGWSEDGTVESIELTGRTFVLGTQWHPEVGADPRLFRAFVRAAGRRRC